ncbi:MAG: HD domain-containing phosphohydrolase [Eubacteriales bacterium]|jgi:diguanylate cyclase (GGDEF)-like protein/PAS domain S-box-containing protein
MNSENEKKNEIRDHISAAHLFSLLILISLFLYSNNLHPRELFQAVNLKLFLLVSLVCFGGVFLYITKTSSLIKDPKAPEFKTKSWVDPVYIIFPLIIAMLTLFILGGKLSYGWVAFLLPILVTSSIMGKNAGLIMSTICVGVLFFYDKLFPGGVFAAQFSGEEPKIIIVCMMYLISWFVGGLSDMEAQRRSELNSRLSLEELVKTISTKFISLTLDEIDGGIQKALETVGEYAGADRAYIFFFNKDGESRHYTAYKWSAQGVELPDGYLKFLAESFPWWVKELNKPENICFSKVKDLPLETCSEKEFLLENNVFSLIIAPIKHGGIKAGFIGLDTVRREKKWTAETVSLVKMAGEVLVNAVERKRAEEELRLSEERFSKAYSASPNLMLIIGCSDHRVIDINNSFLNVTGHIRQEVIGRTVAEINLWTDLMAYSKAIKMIQEQEVIHNLEIKFNKKDGRGGVGLLSADTINLGGGKCILFMMNDISQRKKVEEHLTYLSMHDSLTGLYNRAYFEEEMRRLGEGRHTSVGMIICDVDGLKLINDTFGHNTGDGLLVAAAGVIKNPFRTGDMVSRIGGDEFAVLLPDCDRQQVENACHRIAFNVKRYNEKHPELPLSISIGFAVCKGTSVSMVDLFKEADNNMSREKLHRSRSARSAIVQALMKTLEARDFITENHSKRLQDLVANLARSAGLPEYKLSDLRLLARFHDIGKIGLADRILFKPGPLTSEEALEMQRHCEIGSRIAQSVPDLLPIADWILKHHEWWNGQGYPLQLKGEEIPLESRILSIADAYEAMTSNRPYRKAISKERAVDEIRKYAGLQFDPLIADIFVEGLGDGNNNLILLKPRVINFRH